MSEQYVKCGTAVINVSGESDEERVDEMIDELVKGIESGAEAAAYDRGVMEGMTLWKRETRVMLNE